jgi:uncharacterized membrane protein
MRLSFGLSPVAWALLFLLALAVAGVTHAAALLAIPWRSHRDAFARVAALGPVGTKVLLPEAGTANDSIPFGDPAFVTAVCRYDLGAQPFRLSLSPFATSFVSLGFHSRHGLGFYGLTVQAADATRLDLVLAGRNTAPNAGPDTDDHAITVEVPEPDGFVVLSTPAGESADHAEALERLNVFQCRADATRS